jgi:hypothetical protein
VQDPEVQTQFSKNWNMKSNAMIQIKMGKKRRGNLFQNGHNFEHFTISTEEGAPEP